MYPATVNSLTHETQLVTAQAKKLVNTSNLVNNQVNSDEYFAGRCYTHVFTLDIDNKIASLSIFVNQKVFKDWIKKQRKPTDRRSLSSLSSRNRSPSPY